MKTITKHATFTFLHSNTQNMIDSTQKDEKLISLHSQKRFKIVNRENFQKTTHLLILEAFQAQQEKACNIQQVVEVKLLTPSAIPYLCHTKLEYDRLRDVFLF